MTYQCPKGHLSTDSDYCSECGALIGQSKIASSQPAQKVDSNMSENVGAVSQEICPDCGTPRTPGARFCEVCRHDFQNNKTGVAEAIVESQKPFKSQDNSSITPEQEAKQPGNTEQSVEESGKTAFHTFPKAVPKDSFIVAKKLNVVICVNKDKAASSYIESEIKPDTVDRFFPLDLDENLVGRRSTGKGIYPEIEINDPGVSRRHLKFIKQPDGNFAALELGSANGTEINGAVLEPGVSTLVKAGDELTIGIWTILKLVER